MNSGGDTDFLSPSSFILENLDGAGYITTMKELLQISRILYHLMHISTTINDEFIACWRPSNSFRKCCYLVLCFLVAGCFLDTVLFLFLVFGFKASSASSHHSQSQLLPSFTLMCFFITSFIFLNCSLVACLMTFFFSAFIAMNH